MIDQIRVVWDEEYLTETYSDPSYSRDIYYFVITGATKINTRLSVFGYPVEMDLGQFIEMLRSNNLFKIEDWNQETLQMLLKMQHDNEFRTKFNSL